MCEKLNEIFFFLTKFRKAKFFEKKSFWFQRMHLFSFQDLRYQNIEFLLQNKFCKNQPKKCILTLNQLSFQFKNAFFKILTMDTFKTQVFPNQPISFQPPCTKISQENQKTITPIEKMCCFPLLQPFQLTNAFFSILTLKTSKNSCFPQPTHFTLYLISKFRKKANYQSHEPKKMCCFPLKWRFQFKNAFFQSKKMRFLQPTHFQPFYTKILQENQLTIPSTKKCVFCPLQMHISDFNNRNTQKHLFSPTSPFSIAYSHQNFARKPINNPVTKKCVFCPLQCLYT